MPTRIPLSVLCSVALLHISLASARAWADDRDASSPAVGAAPAQAPALSDEGFALHRRGEYRRAVEKFLQAYALDPDANLLFNIARCYQTLGDVDAAVEKYEAFLANAGPDDPGRKRAAEALRALRRSRIAATPAGGAPVALPAAAADSDLA